MKIDRWTISSNRINIIAELAVKKADAYISNLDYTAQRYCFEKIENTTFSYYDTWPGYKNNIESVYNTKYLIKDIGREYTNLISNKFWLANFIINNNLEIYAPKTYISLNDVKKNVFEEKVLYVKSPEDSMGRGVKCIKTSDLTNIVLPEKYIIQEGIRDVLLHEGRKMDFRFYVLAHNKQLFLHRLGYAIVHAGQYDPDTTSHNIQIGHDVKDGNIELNSRIPFTNFDYYNEIHENLKSLITGISSVFDDVLEKTSIDRYTLFGIDAIPCHDKTMKLLEINSWPWLQRREIVEPVIVPMFASLLIKVVLNMNNGLWVKIK